MIKGSISVAWAISWPVALHIWHLNYIHLFEFELLKTKTNKMMTHLLRIEVGCATFQGRSQDRRQ